MKQGSRGLPPLRLLLRLLLCLLLRLLPLSWWDCALATPRRRQNRHRRLLFLLLLHCLGPPPCAAGPSGLRRCRRHAPAAPPPRTLPLAAGSALAETALPGSRGGVVGWVEGLTCAWLLVVQSYLCPVVQINYC